MITIDRAAPAFAGAMTPLSASLAWFIHPYGVGFGVKPGAAF